MYDRAQGQPGEQEHAAAGPVMYLHARTRLSSECILPDARQAKATWAYSERLQGSACTRATSTFMRQDFRISRKVSHLERMSHTECLLT